MAPSVVVFAPAPLLTITAERDAEGNDEIHVHPGGQGVWVARMVRNLGADAVLCAAFGGEVGAVARGLVEFERITVRGTEIDRATGAYVHDRRGGERRVVAEQAMGPLSRHELDDLYNTTLVAAIDAGVCVLTGAPEIAVLGADTYRRLAADLRTNDVTVVADLSGDQLESALDGGIDVLKVAHEELTGAGLAAGDSVGELSAAVDHLRERGAEGVVVSCGEEPAIADLGGLRVLVCAPTLEEADPRGAGDSMTAALAVALARNLDTEAALRLAAAAGCLNVTRHGLATGQREHVEALAEQVEIKPLPDS
jgi:1-phosphofructokinase